MRLLALALLACLVATDASARILVVAKLFPVQDESLPSAQNLHRQPTLRTHLELVTTTMDRWGGDYDIVPPSVAKTEYVRRGVVTYNPGTPNAYTVTYTGVIIVTGRSALVSRLGALNPDSLTLSTVDLAVDVPNVLDVPVLLIGVNGDWATSTTCSTSTTSGSGTGWNDLNPAGWTRFLSGTDLRWRGANDETYRINTALTAGTYLRNLVGVRRNVANQQGSAAGLKGSVAVRDCMDCDSLASTPGFSSGIDTSQVWMTHYDEPDGSKPIIFCSPDHAGSRETDAGAFLAGMAMLDSLTGGDVFSANKLPITIGIQVRGGWRRGSRSAPGGISPNDSTALKAGIDSLAFLKVPFAVGVNVDSLADYTDDKNWWSRAAPYVHYSPEQWGGVIPGDRAGRSTAASWQRPLDPFGATRTRAIYGDGTCIGADSSLWCLQRANLYKLDSTFTREKVDRVSMAAGLDWVPASGTTTKRDSLISFMSDAGVRAVVTNSMNRNSDPSWAKSNPFSLNIGGSNEPITLGRSAGSYFKNLATPGFADSGSDTDMEGRGGTVGQNDYAYKMLRNVEHFYRGVLQGKAQGQGLYDQNLADAITTAYMGLIDSVGTWVAVNPGIYTIHASDLGSGVKPDWATRTAHPGWWEIKYLVNTARMTNRIANRAIFSFEYPKDVRR